MAEIAQMLRVSRQYVDRLTKTEGFPAPEAVTTAGRIWKRRDVEDWAHATGRIK